MSLEQEEKDFTPDLDDDLLTEVTLTEQQAHEGLQPGEDDALIAALISANVQIGLQVLDMSDDDFYETRGDILLFPVNDDDGQELERKRKAASTEYGIDDIKKILANASYSENLIVHILSNEIEAIANQIQNIPTRVAFYEEIIEELKRLLYEQKFK